MASGVVTLVSWSLYLIQLLINTIVVVVAFNFVRHAVSAAGQQRAWALIQSAWRADSEPDHWLKAKSSACSTAASHADSSAGVRDCQVEEEVVTRVNSTTSCRRRRPSANDALEPHAADPFSNAQCSPCSSRPVSRSTSVRTRLAVSSTMPVEPAPYHAAAADMGALSTVARQGTGMDEDLLLAPRPSTALLLHDKPSFSDLPANEGRIQVIHVDDEPINHIVMQALLQTCNFDVLTMDTGEEVLEQIQTMPVLPDLILLDVSLPGMSGYQVTCKLRETYSAAQLPIIMITCFSGETDVIKGLNAGANDYMTKPVRHAELKARIFTQVALRKTFRVAGEAYRNFSLLKSILPAAVIAQLKQGAQLVAKHHDHVTILFSDIKGFTTMSAQWPPEEIILMLNEMFTAFDNICEDMGVYKVETIGDAYMIVSGHDDAEDHAHRMVRTAKAMLAAVADMKGYDGRQLEIRVGIHTGPAHSGVIGVVRPRYCFFGDTVNTASRMESSGFSGCVQVSNATYQAVLAWQASKSGNHAANKDNGSAAGPDTPEHTEAHMNVKKTRFQSQSGFEDSESDFEFVPCGQRNIKGKGVMSTYLLKAGAWQTAQSLLQRSPGDTSSLLHSIPSLEMNSMWEGIMDSNHSGFTTLQSSAYSPSQSQQHLYRLILSHQDMYRRPEMDSRISQEFSSIRTSTEELPWTIASRHQPTSLQSQDSFPPRHNQAHDGVVTTAAAAHVLPARPHPRSLGAAQAKRASSGFSARPSMDMSVKSWADPYYDSARNSPPSSLGVRAALQSSSSTPRMTQMPNSGVARAVAPSFQKLQAARASPNKRASSPSENQCVKSKQADGAGNRLETQLMDLVSKLTECTGSEVHGGNDFIQLSTLRRSNAGNRLH